MDCWSVSCIATSTHTIFCFQLKRMMFSYWNVFVKWRIHWVTQHLIEHTTQGPHVALISVRLSFAHLPWMSERLVWHDLVMSGDFAGRQKQSPIWRMPVIWSQHDIAFILWIFGLIRADPFFLNQLRLQSHLFLITHISCKLSRVLQEGV